VADRMLQISFKPVPLIPSDPQDLNFGEENIATNVFLAGKIQAGKTEGCD